MVTFLPDSVANEYAIPITNSESIKNFNEDHRNHINFEAEKLIALQKEEIELLKNRISNYDLSSINKESKRIKVNFF